MIASDGLHYGANMAMPKPGALQADLRDRPPSAGGLGRHVGAGGVAPWWEPFEAAFDWTVEPPRRPRWPGSLIRVATASSQSIAAADPSGSIPSLSMLGVERASQDGLTSETARIPAGRIRAEPSGR